MTNTGGLKLIWISYFPLQCTDFVKAGAIQGLTPSDVVSAADITFSCVADPQAAKDVSYRNSNSSRTSLSSSDVIPFTRHVLTRNIF